jgi:hypothetical protein
MEKTKTKKKKTPLAVANIDGQDVHFIDVSYVMEPLVAMFDGIDLTFFGKSKRPYMRLDAAAEWAEREHEHAPCEENKKRADALRLIQSQVAAGLCLEQ